MKCRGGQRGEDTTISISGSKGGDREVTPNTRKYKNEHESGERVQGLEYRGGVRTTPCPGNTKAGEEGKIGETQVGAGWDRAQTRLTAGKKETKAAQHPVWGETNGPVKKNY